MAPGILGVGVYAPAYRLRRSAIGETLGAGGGRGTRAVASYDEDTTTMAVAAARRCLRLQPDAAPPRTLLLSTAHPTYIEKNVASTVHAALGLPATTAAFDMSGSYRAAVGSLLAGLRSSQPALVIHSDMRNGRPQSAEESEGGDAAVALLTGPVGQDGGLATLIGSGSATGEFLDRWKLPGDAVSRSVEERLGEHAYAPLVAEAAKAALQDAGVEAAQVTHLAVAGTHLRAARSTPRWAGLGGATLIDDGFTRIGNPGAAQAGLLLARGLATMEVGELLALVVLADGVDVLLFRGGASPLGGALHADLAALDGPGEDVPYVRYLTWRGLLTREGPRRPDPDPPAPAPSLRNTGWKYALVASRCTECGTRHMPPQRVCRRCGTVDAMEPDPIADLQGLASVVTVDNLAMAANPPLRTALVEFDGGGRFRFEVTDAEPDQVAAGDRLEMTFRRLYTSDGIHDYFWKARPVGGHN